MTKKEKAIKLHNEGHNCAQAVACAFAEDAGIDRDIIFRAAEGFGRGMGSGENVCGAVSGAVLIMGLLNSDGSDRKNSKLNTYFKAAEITEEFKNKNQTLICNRLKGMPEHEPIRSCEGCIEDAVEILEKKLKEGV